MMMAKGCLSNYEQQKFNWTRATVSRCLNNTGKTCKYEQWALCKLESADHQRMRSVCSALFPGLSNRGSLEELLSNLKME